jgi:hypothetical protein
MLSHIEFVRRRISDGFDRICSEGGRNPRIIVAVCLCSLQNALQVRRKANENEREDVEDLSGAFGL